MCPSRRFATMCSTSSPAFEPAHRGYLSVVSTPTALVLRALRLGDLLAAVPALRALRAGLPGHRIVLAAPAWLDPVVRLTGAVDELLPTDGLSPTDGHHPPAAFPARPDVAVNLHGSGPQSTHLLDATRPRRRIGHAGYGWIGPAWRADLHETRRWCRLLGWHGIPADPTDLALPVPPGDGPAPGAVVVHLGAGSPSRRWPVHRFAQVARELAMAGHQVVVTGDSAEQPVVRRLAELAGLSPAAVLAGRTTLTDLATLVARARLVVSGDTGVAHLSYAYRTPSVVLFGPVPARLWGPPVGGPHQALSRDDLRDGRPRASRPDPALLGVGVDAVLSAATELLTVRTNVEHGVTDHHGNRRRRPPPPSCQEL